MNIAIVKTGGKQYIVNDGAVLTVEKLPQTKDGKITFSEVLLTDDGKKVNLGNPTISGAEVVADFIAEGKGQKIRVLKYKNKVRYKKTIGHRQQFTKVKVAKVA